MKRLSGQGLGAAALWAPTLLAASPAAAGEVVVTVTDIRSSKGVVRACLSADQDSFPRCKKDPEALRVRVPAGETVTIRFSGVKPGSYGIAVLHDENDDGKANRVLGMMPKEGYGFSRDAPVRMAPPKFEDAVFEHKGEDQQLTIAMRYFL
ncbi:MAG: DUF2141 domain-containing protein [Erythrobacter sp.]|uniref:DUF2141 domain-containing protein n=1 Tax=Erythrobacter sp. TaxID=1042 RepID=UPI002638C54D|nr:DUF2141 domain-containing protein [Erythrobacter sp.]MDJ0978555.1 DUF2141 domain-containing protein [Erythrobacter sp.]